MADLKSHHIDPNQPGPASHPLGRYQFQPGDRPIEGYTIRHAAGRGAFGEVYSAVSDSGREIALKAIQTGEQIELRGIGHCMNLKSPYIVSTFDVRHSERGQPFVLMEFVAGPSLRELLDDAPSGLGEQKAAFFLREIAKGLSYLHDHGIVHRDLKPANIFYEDGYVKIGDYGLSKAIGASPQSGQTITVGTVHYMAPEIGQGRYDRAIDIYALGCILYEMLTGTVPYFGSSVGEILIKHAQGAPDLQPVPEPFRRVVEKAMAKNPADRYPTVQAMVEDVFGEAHVRQSLAEFSPTDLSLHAARVARKLDPHSPATPPRSAPDASPPPPRPAAAASASSAPIRATTSPPAKRSSVVRSTTSASRREIIDAAPAGRSDATSEPVIHDPVPRMVRLILSILGGLALSSAAAWYGGLELALVAYLMLIGSVGAGWMIRSIFRHLEKEDPILRQLTYALGMYLGLTILALPYYLYLYPADLRMNMLGLAIGIVLIRWHPRTRPARGERIRLWPTLYASIIALLVSFLIEADPVLMLTVIAGSSLLLEMICPFDREFGKSQKNYPTAFDEPHRPMHPRTPLDQSRREARPTPPTQHRQTRSTTRKPPIMPVNRYHTPPSEMTQLLLLLMAGLGFVGIFGIHRFLAGKWITGLIWFFTGGLFLIGQLIDVALIASGSFRDSKGQPVTVWGDLNSLFHVNQPTTSKS